MKKIFYESSSRGHQNHGWLNAKHTFSFANYYDPDRINFGALRVLNDDIVEGGKGFGRHPHDNMEIITIPLFGELAHQDSMGFKGVIKSGEVQVMSAGSGLYHSEFNASETEPLNLFQIWIFTNHRDVPPRYDSKIFKTFSDKNELTLVVSPDGDDESMWIYQDAWISIGNFDKDVSLEYRLKFKDNGVFIMSIEGEFLAEDQHLEDRDAVGIWDVDSVNIKSLSNESRILIIEVPMEDFMDKAR